ncbi:hypothetical protein BKA64DRAFT_147158 [Cadophora sp. MPI-SDFR-AT-0126]|nr:hypothetical protein BKA64DRAFT_147158 [Leotiomycetes sp. MPI-SDFR-AT-0126]
MPPRKPHNKSRAGCDTCKKRRVKCDERGPPCTRCVTRGAECHFSARTPKALGRSPEDLTITENAASISKTSENPPKGRSDTDHPLPTLNALTHPRSPGQSFGHVEVPGAPIRLLELELLHHFSTKTYQGLSLLGPDQEIWQVFAVEQALKFEFLMKEIFALAALHKATEMPESRSKYVNLALEWKNEALVLSHDALQNISQENSDAIFMFSIMTMIFAIVPPLSVPGITWKSPLENLLVLFEFQKGTASLAEVCRHWLETGSFRWIFESKTPEQPPEPSENFSAAIIRLAQLNENYTNASADDSGIFSKAISSLSFCSVGNRGRVLAWLAMAGQEFLSKLNEDNPMALLILIHWAVLLETLNDLWWAKNAGTLLVKNLITVLERVALNSRARPPPGWAEAVGWARWEAGVGAYS